MTADLLVICVTRGRPQHVPALWDAWQATADGCADLMFAVDDDDPELGAYLDCAPMPGTFWYTGPRLGLARTLNAVAVQQAPRYRMLASWGDDHRPRTRGWDTRLVQALDGLGSGVAYGNDLLQGEHIPTAAAMTSDIVQALGYMAAPGMQHLCIDVVWKNWGEAMGRLAYLPDVIIEHCHPHAGTAPMDAGYAETYRPERSREDQEAYWSYRRSAQYDCDVGKLRALVAS
jgi:hypothetical protein